MIPQMIAAEQLHEVPNTLRSFCVISPSIIVDPLATAEDSISESFRRFYSFGPDGPRRKPFLEVVAHEEVADLVPLFYLFISILLPVVEPPSPFHIEVRHGAPRLDDVQLQMHEDLDAQLPHALLRVGVLLPPQEGQALEAGLCGRLS